MAKRITVMFGWWCFVAFGGEINSKAYMQKDGFIFMDRLCRLIRHGRGKMGSKQVVVYREN
jgi:hypothetical protein